MQLAAFPAWGKSKHAVRNALELAANSAQLAMPRIVSRLLLDGDVGPSAISMQRKSAPKQEKQPDSPLTSGFFLRF